MRHLMLPLCLVAIGLVGCSGHDPVSANASVASLVGDWQATRFQVTNKANPAQSPELIHDLGAQFTLDVQPSGQYTAILAYQGTPITELGSLSVEQSDVVFHVTYPSSETSRSHLTLTSGRMTLDGDTEFDFNNDAKPDPATAHIELQRK
jgi:hypothetical protein